jgi:UDP:flavonoid glycosyltransferase YjiC (YdhE family)
MRTLLSAVGWAGHALPTIALARALATRGHEVVVDTSPRWRDVVEGEGLRFAPAEEHIAFPAQRDDRGRGPSLAEAVRARLPMMREYDPSVVVSDLFTLTPALAAEAAGKSRATLIPDPYPVYEPGLPFFPLGLLPPRTRVGAGAWRAMWPLVGTRLPSIHLKKGRRDLNQVRRELGLPELDRFIGQISDWLTMVATFPQLEYPRRWPPHVHVTGPIVLDLPHPDVELPEEGRALVLVASSTEQDRELSLLRVALEALQGEPVRVLGTISRQGQRWRGPVPENAEVVDWASYAQVMPKASLVLSNGGHGTVARALTQGVPVLICPDAGNMAEIGARVAWAGAGLMLPKRLLAPGPVRWAVRRLLAERRFTTRAREIAAWSRDNDGAARAAALVERHAQS